MTSEGLAIEYEEIDVELPRDLLAAMDEHAATHGYRGPSDLVRVAIESSSEIESDR